MPSSHILIPGLYSGSRPFPYSVPLSPQFHFNVKEGSPYPVHPVVRGDIPSAAIVKSRKVKKIFIHPRGRGSLSLGAILISQVCRLRSPQSQKLLKGRKRDLASCPGRSGSRCQLMGIRQHAFPAGRGVRFNSKVVGFLSTEGGNANKGPNDNRAAVLSWK